MLSAPVNRPLNTGQTEAFSSLLPLLQRVTVVLAHFFPVPHVGNWNSWSSVGFKTILTKMSITDHNILHWFWLTWDFTPKFLSKKKKNRKNLLHLSLLPTSSSFPDFQDSAIMQYLILNFCLNVNSCLCWLLIYSEVKLSSDNAFRDCRYFRRLSSICPRSWKMFFSFVEAS